VQLSNETDGSLENQNSLREVLRVARSDHFAHGIAGESSLRAEHTLIA
jgi:hypothetical protein